MRKTAYGMRIVDWSSDVCSSGLADAPEIVEIDAQLIGRVRGAHEGGLVDTEPLDEAADVRQGRLADPDDADILAFDQRDRNQRPEQLRKRARAHPSRRAAPQPDDADCPPAHHRAPPSRPASPARSRLPLLPASFPSSPCLTFSPAT